MILCHFDQKSEKVQLVGYVLKQVDVGPAPPLESGGRRTVSCASSKQVLIAARRRFHYSPNACACQGAKLERPSRMDLELTPLNVRCSSNALSRAVFVPSRSTDISSSVQRWWRRNAWPTVWSIAAMR